MMDRGSMINIFKKLGLVTSRPIEKEGIYNSEIFQKYTWFRYFRLD